MPLATGARIGSYEVIGALGAGGMGEVYRARDTKLGREVALKLVLEAFLTDRDRLARFEREARTLAALNHPNIATLYGLEEADGRHFLVMELVPGLTLKDLITLGHPEAESVSSRLRDSASAAGRGGGAPRSIKIDDALPIAIQITEALEAAHESGIVHRDLKPANIKITADGKVKVLDFGLATTGRSDASSAAGSIANSPTLTATGTLAGAILGTASYMSPEQARGMAADHRSDIFSFGVVFFEMLTGRQPFLGETVSDVLASVLAREPDLAALPPGLPPRLSELVARCLEKQPKRRWQAIGDIRHELEVIARHETTSGVVSTRTETPGVVSPQWRRALPVAGAILATVGITIAATTFMHPAPATAPVTRFTIPYAEGLQLTVRPGIAISPDGSRVAYVLNRRLYVRELAAFDGRAVTPGANAAGGAPLSPVFSPDGAQIAYFDNVETALKIVPAAGGSISTACKLAEMPTGLSWSGDFIYMAATPGIQRVMAAGGSPETVIKKDPEDLITGPQVLDDGRLLYSIAKRDPGILDRWVNARIVVQRPGDPQPTVVVEKGSDPRYLRSGHLVYVYGGVLYARRLALDSAAPTVGPQTPMVEGVFRSAGTQGAGLWWYGISENGTLVYQPGSVGAMGEQQLAIALYARDGKIEPTKIRPGPYWHPRMSPDGRRIAFGVDDGREVSLWMYDIAAGSSPTRLTFGGRTGGRDRYPVWSHDSQRLIFQSDRDGAYSLYSQAADGSDSPIRLTTADKAVEHVPQSVSPDGATLLFDETRDGMTVLKAYVFKDKSISPYGDIQSVVPTGAVFSRNGRWVAYTMRPARQSLAVIEVQPYPATGPKYQVSLASEDGHHAIWSHDGKELFYTPGPGALFNSVTVNTAGQAFSYGPGPGFARKFANMAPSTERPYDVAKNAKGEPVILGLSSNTADPTKEEQIELRVVVNWVEELKARVK